MFKEYNLYMKMHGKKSRSATVRSYKRTLLDLFEYFKVSHLDDLAGISVSDYLEYQIHMMDSLSSSSINVRFFAIKAFLNWLDTFDMMVSPKISKIKNLPVKKPLVVVLSQKESDAIMASDIRLQWKIHVRLMLDIGLRNFETARVQVKNIVWMETEKRWGIEIIDGKGGKDACLPVSDEFYNMLVEYLDSKKDVQENDYLVCLSGSKRLGKKPVTESSVYQRTKEILRISGMKDDRISKISPHSFRRTFVTRLANDPNIPIAQASFLARHSSIRVTMRYVRVDESQAYSRLIDNIQR